MGDFSNWTNQELGELVESLDRRNDELLEREKKAWEKAARNWQSLDIVLGLLIDKTKKEKELETAHKIIDELQDALFDARRSEETCGTPIGEEPIVPNNCEISILCSDCLHFPVCMYKTLIQGENCTFKIQGLKVRAEAKEGGGFHVTEAMFK